MSASMWPRLEGLSRLHGGCFRPDATAELGACVLSRFYGLEDAYRPVCGWPLRGPESTVSLRNAHETSVILMDPWRCEVSASWGFDLDLSSYSREEAYVGRL